MAVPLKPPADWFNQPEPDAPQPLRYESDGRVSGHLALWDQCHIGFAECIRPQRDDTFQNFHTGIIETADGEPVAVGKIVYDGPHASTSPGTTVQAAAQHYDDNTHVGAYVRASAGRFGIWLSGVLRSDLPETGLRDMRANPPSGDWRGIRGKLSLIAALAVPIPGYPIPQVSVTASGDTPVALIMPGYTEEEEMADMRGKGYVRRKRMIQKSLVAAPLTAKRRNALSARDFAIPETRSYPIYDMGHARNALARSSGKPEEMRVRRAVCRRYPDMGECGK